MKRVLSFVILFLIFPWSALYSQQLSHQVLVPLAGLVTGDKLNYSQTAGETAVEVVGCFDYIFTQGFQQPGIRISDEQRPEGTGAKIYPNPADEYLTVEIFGERAGTLRIELIDITGTVIMTDQKSFNSSYWLKESYKIDHLTRGFYLVRILATDGFLNRTFKIEKI